MSSDHIAGRRLATILGHLNNFTPPPVVTANQVCAVDPLLAMSQDGLASADGSLAAIAQPTVCLDGRKRHGRRRGAAGEHGSQRR